MTTLTQASRQWMSRPHDERFLSLYEMADRMRSLRERSHNEILSIKRVEVQPDSDHRGLLVNGVEPTHHAFSQLCTLASPGASPAPPSPSAFPSSYSGTGVQGITQGCGSGGCRCVTDRSPIRHRHQTECH